MGEGKEQEAIYAGEDEYFGGWWKCGSCGYYVTEDADYCGGCGLKLVKVPPVEDIQVPHLRQRSDVNG